MTVRCSLDSVPLFLSAAGTRQQLSISDRRDCRSTSASSSVLHVKERDVGALVVSLTGPARNDVLCW